MQKLKYKKRELKKEKKGGGDLNFFSKEQNNLYNGFVDLHI